MRHRPSLHRAAVLLAGAVVAVTACAQAGTAPTWTYPPTSGGEGAPPASQVAMGAEPLVIEAFDLGFTPASLEVPTAGRYEVRLVNTGAAPHDITFPTGETGTAQRGETVSLEVDIPGEGTTFLCSIPGHATAGMTGDVKVAGAATASSDPNDHGGPVPTTGLAPDANAPAPVRYDPAAPARMPGSVHDIDLVMTEQEMTVAEGFVVKVWTFGGSVPGPVIRVKVGDTIRVHLKNPADNQLSHSIDFHASQVAWNDEMRSIAPGEELVYEWTAAYAGVWMYHCGTSPALHHIANGMYGMVIVEPAGGLQAVDNEFALVQSEWYLGPQGEPSDLAKAAAAAPAPDLVVFNGVANQYRDAPIQVGTGETNRIFVLNAGPSVDSSFHIVGTIFDTVIREGVHLAKGNAGTWGSQAIDLAPAQGGIVEFTTAEDGLYPIVTHAFNFVGRGALGLVQAGDGDPAN